MTVPLSEEDFRKVVDLTPLVAIDLVATDASGRVLLGHRRNRPAQGYWFVPGGRILKGEHLDDAFTRITKSELGVSLGRSQASLLGVFEHLYEDSVFGSAGEGPTTHYVVVAYTLPLGSADIALPKEQHSDYRWQHVADAVSDEDVHPNSRTYFQNLAKKVEEERGEA